MNKKATEDAAAPDLIRQSLSNAEVQVRLGKLEADIRRVAGDQLDRHTRQITLIFSIVGLFVTGLGIWSKIDSRDATRDMESRIDKATTEMQRRFEALSGQALKRAQLQILADNMPLNRRVFEISGPSDVNLGPIFLTNVGEKRTDTLSIRLYCSDYVNLVMSGYWQTVASNDRDYKFSWYLTGSPFTIDPKETLTLESTLHFQYGGSPTTNLNFKLAVFYGAENPAEAEFVAKIKR